MLVSKNSLEDKILANLRLSWVIGEEKLFDQVCEADGREEFTEFRRALFTLLNQGEIEVLRDQTDTMDVIRLKQVAH